MVERIGNWVQTYTGKQFWPLDPRPEDVDILDIAHSLSMQCRYAGHCERFYSVAEHCVHLCDYATDRNKLWALLHDASEAYCADIPRPLKPYLTNYASVEAVVMKAVCHRFELEGFATPQEVDELDGRILNDEREQNMKRPPEPWVYTGEKLGIELKFWTPVQAKIEFLARFQQLTQG